MVTENQNSDKSGKSIKKHRTKNYGRSIKVDKTKDNQLKMNLEDSN